MSIYSRVDLEEMGFAAIGKNVRISTRASFYGISRIEIGDNVRIDDFCVLSAGEGGIKLGSFIHIGVYSCIIGAGRVVLADFANISSRVTIYSNNDDYTGEYMTSPMVDSRFTNVQHAPVNIGRHAIIGSGSVVLPGIDIGDGCAVGALTMVNTSLEAWNIYAGQPARLIKARKKDLLIKEKEFLSSREVL